jgi:DNA recombination protein RmuC
MEYLQPLIHSLVPFWQAILISGLLLAGLAFGLVQRHRGREWLWQRDLAERQQSLEVAQARVVNLEENQRAERETSTHWHVQAATFQARLEEEQKSAREREQVLQNAEQRLSNAFKALSAETLQASQASFLEMASATLAKQQESVQGDLKLRQQAIDSMVKPVAEQLKQVDEKIQQLEKSNAVANQGLLGELGHLRENNAKLQAETGSLVNALRQPKVRGSWGELQLRKAVEVAGMLEYCDFNREVHVAGEASNYRPDMVVRLPGGRNIVVDAKTPMEGYLDACQATDDATRDAAMKRHASQIRTHIKQLSQKSYFEHFQPSPDFVVLFLPGEMFFSAALEIDPSLIEIGSDQKVLIASPTTLIALLRTASYGWQQEALTRNAKQISELGKELYDRLAILGSHFEKLGSQLGITVATYNKAVGSLESRVLVTARKFRDCGISESSTVLDDINLIDEIPRLPQSSELTQPDSLAA